MEETDIHMRIGLQRAVDKIYDEGRWRQTRVHIQLAENSDEEPETSSLVSEAPATATADAATDKLVSSASSPDVGDEMFQLTKPENQSPPLGRQQVGLVKINFGNYLSFPEGYILTNGSADGPRSLTRTV